VCGGRVTAEAGERVKAYGHVGDDKINRWQGAQLGGHMQLAGYEFVRNMTTP